MFEIAGGILLALGVAVGAIFVLYAINALLELYY